MTDNLHEPDCPALNAASTRLRAFALQALLQGDGVSPAQFDAAVTSIGRLNLPLRLQYGFVYLNVPETDERSLKALERELARLR